MSAPCMQSELTGHTAASAASLAGSGHPTGRSEACMAAQQCCPSSYCMRPQAGCARQIGSPRAAAASGLCSLVHAEHSARACCPSLQGHKAPVMGMAVDPSGAMLATASADSTVKVWDTAGTYCTHSFAGHR